jgi:hypothetical protein
MLEMVKESMRGGISIITHRYAEANNKYMKSYNPNEKSTYIMYYDANNLYGKAMCERLPIGDYAWDNNILLKDILNIKNNSDEGVIAEFDMEIPKDKHDYFNCYPPAVENTRYDPSPHMEKIKEMLNIKECKVDKLIPNLNNKIKYVAHHKNIQLFIELGCIITKIHRVLKFKQKSYLKDYIMFNTQKRTETTYEHEKDLFKLLNNSIFGKCMENVEKRIDVKIVNSEKLFMKHVNKPYYKGHKIFNNDLAAVHLNKTSITYNKPIIVGFCILELSKTHMYDFHYNTMKNYYKDDIKLLFTDTDSLCYHIKTDDVYNDMNKLNNHFDLSEYKKDHKCYNPTNKKVVGKFKDEFSNKIIKRFWGVRSKCYKIETDDNETKETFKGIKKHIAKDITVKMYNDCIFNNKTTNHNFNMME